MKKRTGTRTNPRQEGMALITSLILVVILVSFSGAMLFISLAESRGIQESTLQKIAFYTAEAGLEAGKYEIGDAIDPDGDGIGSKTFTSTTNDFAVSYTVVAEDLGLEFYRLTSTGTVRQTSVKLEAIVEKIKTSAFPVAAFSSLGNLDDAVLKIVNKPYVIFDGGYSAAIGIGSNNLFNRLASELMKAITKGNLKSTLSGATYLTSILSGKTLREAELPISHETDPTRLTNLSVLYDELVDRVNNTMIPTAIKALPKQLIYGTSTAPGTFYQPLRITLLKNQTLSGYGTLVAHDFTLPYGATVNWNGNLIVTGNMLKAANIDLLGGSLNVTGNLIVLGEGKDNALVSVKTGSRLTVNGSLLLATSYQAKSGKDVKVDLEGGKITVNGIMTLLGGKIDAQFKPGGRLDVTGMMQSGSPQGAGTEKQKIHFDGPARIIKDDAAIRRGTNSWLQTGTSMNLVQGGELSTDEVITHAWYQIY
jgi:hypothetical protein